MELTISRARFSANSQSSRQEITSDRCRAGKPPPSCVDIVCREKHSRLCSISSILLVGSGLSTKAFGAVPKYARLKGNLMRDQDALLVDAPFTYLT